MDQFLQVSSLSRAYRSGDVETQALDAVSFEVAAGEFVALMGPSGCGKSTLLNILGFLDPPDAGSYRLRGEEVATLSDARLTRLRRGHVGFVFQNFNLIDELNVAENVEVALLYRSGDARRRRIDAVLEQVGLAHRARHRPRQLSGGQQQRVAIARALAPEPDLILADEPTGNLDTANGAAVMELLKGSAAAGTTVIMVTHSALHAAATDRTIRMLDGRIVGETRL
ncbi:MAG TPA: ABC transporter ATP-binding protein [Allosphingosinicella sp.]|jgi:putative ABC transport system ATP-binding protein|uniref:ABC transporter ATP-binding protein n=1 Tax=Allosphingosinicella sp. TaxID=2823234 RepID=UPI002F273051